MQSDYHTSLEEKEKIFCTELVKYEKAVKAARILVSGQPDDFLTVEEIKIVKDACKHWLIEKKRFNHVKASVVNLNK